MNKTIKDLEKSQKEIFVTVSAEEMNSYAEKAMKKLAGEVELPGFRKGKAPLDLVKQKMNPMKTWEEAAHLAINDTYGKILEEEKSLHPLGQPQVEITKLAPENEMEYRLVFAVMPKVELGDYKAVKGKLEVTKVSDEKVAGELKHLQRQRATYLAKDDSAVKGDRVEIDFEVREGGVKIEGGESKNHPLVLGEGKFIPGFEDELVGMKADEEKEFELKFPEDYKNGLGGKTANFKVKMNVVQKVDLPPLDDEFAKAMGEKEGLEKLKANIRHSLEHEAEHHAEHHLDHELMEQVTKDLKAELPEVLIDSQLHNMLAEFKGNLAQSGMEMEKYLEMVGSSEEKMREEWRTPAENKVRENLAVREISLREKLEASAEEIDERVDKTLAMYPNGEEIRGKINLPRFRDYMAGEILRGKVIEFLRECAQKNEKAK